MLTLSFLYDISASEAALWHCLFYPAIEIEHGLCD